MYKVSYDTREWNSDNFHFHLDVTSQKDHVTGKIRGWFVDKNQADLELRLCDNEGKRNDKIVLSIHRPKLPSMYPSIKNVSLSGFEIDLNDFDKCQKLSISIVDIKNNICIAVPVIFSIFIPLLYIHIPKTAGSTVNKFLLERFASTRSLIHVESKDSWKDRLVSGDVDFISGHLTYKNFMRNSLLHCFNKAITFRDPYQHITSHLSWIRSLSLDENNSRYLAHPEYIQKLSDKLVSCDFTDAKNISSVISGFEQPEHQLLDNTQTRYIRTDVSKMNVDGLDVKDSLDNLKSFDFVGIDSNIELFLSDIAVSYGFKPSINGIRENVLSTKFGIDPSRDDIRKALEPLIRFDLQLYREIQSDIDFLELRINVKRFILHLGFHKTATSSIQRTLSSNKDLLDELGFFYPIFFRGSRRIINHSIPFYSVYSEKPELYHVNIRNGDSQNIVSVNEEYSSKIDEVLDCNKNVIISGEDISILSESALENIKCKIQEKGFSLEVYCFVRKPYSFTCSALQERIKNGTAVLDDIRVASKAVDVLKLKSVFGKDVHFFSFENICLAKEPVVFFIEMLGIESSKFSIVNSNEGLGNLSTRILAYLNVNYPIIKDGCFYVKGRRFFDKSIDNEKFFLTGDEVDEIRPALIKENKRLFDILGKDFTDDEFSSSKSLNIDIDSAVKIYSTYKESHTSLAILHFIKENSKFNISCMCDYFSKDPDFRRDFSMIYEKDDSCFCLGYIKDSKK